MSEHSERTTGCHGCHATPVSVDANFRTVTP